LDVSVVADNVSKIIPHGVIQKRDVTGWKQYVVPLDSFTNAQCVWIDFTATNSIVGSTGGQYLDRIYIYADQNLSLDTVYVSGLSACNFSNMPVQVRLRNTTTTRIDFSRSNTGVVLEVRKGSPTAAPTYNTFPLTQGGVSGLSSWDVTVATMTFDTGTFYLRAWLLNPIDNNPLDDTTRRATLSIRPDISITASPNTNIATGSCFSKYDSTTTQVITITNKGNFDVQDIPVVLEIHGNTVQYYYDTLWGVLQTGKSDKMTFASYNIPKNAIYSVRVRAILPCDVYSTDNTHTIQECVDMEDIEVVSVVNPHKDTIGNVGDVVNLEVLVKNLSPSEIYSGVKIYAVVPDGSGNITLNGTIDNFYPGDRKYTFTQPYTVPPVSNYSIKVYIDKVDNYPKNDTITETRQTNNGIVLPKTSGFSMEQNVPNPAKNETRIAYSIPSDGQVIFTVYTVVGQVLHVEKRDSHSGDNEVEFNTINLSSGIYYYSMEYKGEKLVKKMTIRK